MLFNSNFGMKYNSLTWISSLGEIMSLKSNHREDKV